MVSLSELLKQCSERNRSATDLQVLSVNNKYGFIAQSDQFEDREVASDDTTNYKVVEKGMFAYNPARINVGSIALYEMDGKGIVSPMYVCFTTKRTKCLNAWRAASDYALLLIVCAISRYLCRVLNYKKMLVNIFLQSNAKFH